MKDKDFDIEYEDKFKGKCPAGDSFEHKRVKCYFDLNDNGIAIIESTCKICWREYIKQKDYKH